MKAMIFAAGLGTRLAPLTNDRPKAMVEVGDMPLLEICIRRLIRYGFTNIVVNVHHFADLIIDFLKDKDNFGINIIISDEREMLLETGGGLKKAAWFFDDNAPFLVCNVDILTNLNLRKLYDTHCTSWAIATLATRTRTTSRYLLFDEKNTLQGWENVKTGEVRLPSDSTADLTPFAFSGIHILNPSIFDLIRETGKFSIIETYLNLVPNHTLKAYSHDADIWLDVGKPESLAKAEEIHKAIL